MPRPTSVIGLLALATLCWVCVAPGQTPEPRQTAQEWSVSLDVEGEKTPAEKITDLNQKIMKKLGAGEQGPLLGDLYNDLGVVHAQLEEWAPARDAFIHAVQVKPYDPDFHRNLGMVFLHLEQYDLAISELEAYRDTGGPRALDAYRRLGLAHARLGDVAGARAAYGAGLEAFGREPNAETCRLGMVLAGLEQEQGDSEAARKVLESWQPVALAWRETAAAEDNMDGVVEAETIETNLLSIYLEDGQILEESGLMAEAVDLYERAYELAPDRDELLPRIVGAYLASGDVFTARVTARMARQDHPDKAGAWLATARVHEADQDLEKAVVAYKRAYDIAPETPGLRLKVGNLFMKLGRGSEGRPYLVEAIKAPGTPTEVVYNYAVSLMREKKFSAATAPLKRVTQEAPEFAGGWQALAQCYRARKQYSSAVDAYRRALELQPSPKTAYNLGVTAGRGKMWDQAIAAYDQALTLDPGYDEAAYNRAVALMSAGRLAEADTAFATYRERDPEHYRANLNHGVTLYKLQRYDDAIEVYNITLELKETAEAWDNMGLCYQAQGNKTKAQKCFKEAKKLRGGS